MIPVSNLKSDRAYEQLVSWIRSGKFMPGNRLPSEQALSRELGVNHQTLRRGMEKLVNDGLVVKRPSVGNFVAELPDVVGIAVVLPDWMRQSRQQHPLVGLLLSGVYQKLDSRRHSVSILYYRPGQLWADVGVVLASRRAHGAIIKVDQAMDQEDLRQFLDANIKVVLIGSCPPNLAELGLPSFRYDAHLPIGPMMRKLYDLGHRDLAVFEYTHELPHTRASRHEVVQRIAGEAGIKNWSDMLVQIPNIDGHPKMDVIKEVLSRAERPTALVVPDELIASEVFSYCYQNDIKIPDDLSLVAWCDNQPLNHAVLLTAPDTVWLHTQEAQMAAEHLVNSIAGQKQASCEVVLHGEINWTDSIGPPTKSREMAIETLSQTQ